MRIDVDLALLGAPHDHRQPHPGVKVVAGAAEGCRDGGCTLLFTGQPRDAVAGDAVNAAGLLARYRRHGAGMVDALHGGYAIALIDADAARVMLFSDRMGTHTWCHASDGARLRVSDRADTIADGAAIDPQALFTYLFNHVIPSPATVYRGVRRLEPAHRLIATAAGCTVAPHWQPVFAEARAADFKSLQGEFRTLLRGAVEREWKRHGSGTATFLSGGTDSSTVSGLLREVCATPVRAYSIGFDADGYDEMAFARIAARHFGLDHREHYLSPDDVAAGMPLVAAHYDQPFGNSSAVAAHHCARAARDDGCSVLLAGDGGDELFGGNARYAKQSMFGWYERVPAALRRHALQPLLDNRWAERIPGVGKAASYVQQARVPMPDRLQMYNLLGRLGLAQVLTPAFLAQVDPGHDMAGQRAEYERSRGAHGVNRMLAFDWKYTLADNDLPKVIGTTGLAGIGVAFPLLADDVIDFSLRLPAHYKLNGLKLRWFFKEALRGFLPDAILAKKKQGFGLPFGVWALRHERLARLADDALASFATRGVVAAGFIERLRRELLPQHPGYYGELVWIIAMLELWLQAKNPQWRLAA